VRVQGVSKSEGLGHKNRIEATLHADTSYYQVRAARGRGRRSRVDD